MTATLDPSDDPQKATQALQRTAEQLVEDHKTQLLATIEELHELTETQAEMRGLEQSLKRAQDRLAEIRKENPTLQIE